MLYGILDCLKLRNHIPDGAGFFILKFVLVGGLLTAASIFPNVLPSTNTVNPSLTIYNVAADNYGLSVGVYWFVIALILVIAYFIINIKCLAENG
jgi:cytochrome d ubiquinol oxidase subunit II